VRKYGRVDANQGDVVKVLLGAGFSVASLASLGGGVGDILVGGSGINVMIEVKVGNEPLTPAEKKFHAEWKGQIAIARTPEQALQVAIDVIYGGLRK